MGCPVEAAAAAGCLAALFRFLPGVLSSREAVEVGLKLLPPLLLLPPPPPATGRAAGGVWVTVLGSLAAAAAALVIAFGCMAEALLERVLISSSSRSGTVRLARRTHTHPHREREREREGEADLPFAAPFEYWFQR